MSPNPSPLKSLAAKWAYQHHGPAVITQQGLDLKVNIRISWHFETLELEGNFPSTESLREAFASLALPPRDIC